MKKTILITGSTDGLGLEAAKRFVTAGHTVLIHGRNQNKLEQAAKTLADLPADGSVESYLADLSKMSDVEGMAAAVLERHDTIDVVINNAGILKTAEPTTPDGLDVRFVVNTLAPYRLTQRLLPHLATDGRVVNLSSAAQAPVDLELLAGRSRLDEDLKVYAQSKLAITMWSRSLADSLSHTDQVVVALNPGSLLGTKMVKEGFGMAGKDIGIGADIIYRAALSGEFANANGLYFDNDSGQFAPPHADALDEYKIREVVETVETVLSRLAKQ